MKADRTKRTTVSDQEKLLLDRDSAAQMISVSTRTIDNAIRSGDLAAYRIGRRVLIRPDALLEYAQRTPTQRGPEIERRAV